MTNGTTAIQVSPDGLEPDMRIVFDMFTRASNAIVNASDLAKTVAKQEADASHLRDALGALEEANRHLNDRLNETIQARDKATAIGAARGQTIDTQSTTIRQLLDIEAQLTAERNDLRIDRQRWRDEADGWLAAHNKIEAELHEANGKLATMRQTMQSVFGVVAPPEPSPVVPDPVGAVPDPAGQTEPEIIPTMEAVYHPTPPAHLTAPDRSTEWPYDYHTPRYG